MLEERFCFECNIITVVNVSASIAKANSGEYDIIVMSVCIYCGQKQNIAETKIQEGFDDLEHGV